MKKEEHYLQVAIHNLLSKYKIFHFSVPNGGLRRVSVARALKAEGALAGVSDLIILFPNEAIFIEVKNGKKGVQSDSQKTFQKIVEKYGFQYIIWRNLDDCIDFIKKNIHKNQ